MPLTPGALVCDYLARFNLPMSSRKSPSFRRPPVVETVLSIQFDPFPKFRNAHLGAFWKALGDGWGEADDAPPLPVEIEQFGNVPPWQDLGMVGLQLSPVQPQRLRIFNATRDRIVQLQYNRLTYNWLSNDPVSREHYPRYKVIRPEFDEMLQRLRVFAADEGIGEVHPNQWEVLYVNHIQRGTLWSTPKDWHRVFRDGFIGPSEIDDNVVLESVGGTWSYEIKPQRGRLHVGFYHGRTGGAPVSDPLVLQMTARGPLPEVGAKSAVGAGLDIGHEAIVFGFARLTSDEAHRYWEREQ